MGLPLTRDHDHAIPLIEGVTAIKIRPYRYPHHHKAQIELMVKQMLQEGIIQPSNNPFSSPILLVKKYDLTTITSNIVLQNQVITSSIVADIITKYDLKTTTFSIVLQNQVITSSIDADIIAKYDLKTTTSSIVANIKTMNNFVKI